MTNDQIEEYKDKRRCKSLFNSERMITQKEAAAEEDYQRNIEAYKNALDGQKRALKKFLHRYNWKMTKEDDKNKECIDALSMASSHLIVPIRAYHRKHQELIKQLVESRRYLIKVLDQLDSELDNEKLMKSLYFNEQLSILTQQWNKIVKEKEEVLKKEKEITSGFYVNLLQDENDPDCKLFPKMETSQASSTNFSDLSC